MELLLLFMNANDGGALEAAIFENRLSQTVFFLMFFYATMKLYCSFKIYNAFIIDTDSFQPQIGNQAQDDNYNMMQQ